MRSRAATAPSASALAEPLAPIGLDEVAATAELLQRRDRKYVVPLDELPALADALAGTHRALVIDGRRAFRYRTTYFDTPELSSFLDHQQGRRRRFKCRVREYADSGDRWFEVKLKGPAGRTEKLRTRCGPPPPGPLTGPLLGMMRDAVAAAYGRRPPPLFRAALTMEYTRTTLVAPELGERLTCDVGLRFADGGVGMREGLAILESKSALGRAAADRALRALGVRPVADCSKYCLGVALTVDGVRANRLMPLLRRYFDDARSAASGS